MKLRRPCCFTWLSGMAKVCLMGCWLLVASAAHAADRAAQATILSTKGTVEFSPAGSANWYRAATNQTLYVGDSLRTGERSRATLRLLDLSILPVGELTTIRLQERARRASLYLLRGILSFFHRDRPGDIEIEGGGVNATIRGTEFVFAVDADGTATVVLYDGAVQLTNPWGQVLLDSGDVAAARPGEPPRKTATILFGDLEAIQWALYYPAIMDPLDLGWQTAPDPALQPSFAAYQSGDLPQALASYPANRSPASPEENLFLAGLLLSVGNVTDAEHRLSQVTAGETSLRLAAALRQLIAAVKRQPCSITNAHSASVGQVSDLPVGGVSDSASGPPALARPGHRPAGLPHLAPESLTTELLAASYCLQSQARLEEALDAARLATERSPAFGFAWSRRAELEFSFGRVRPARGMLEHARALTPRNAEALALEGFLHAADNQIGQAESFFHQALTVDGALGNAWLGRGLCRIRRGDLAGGRADLETAAALEPQRAVLRSYLGKAFTDEGRAAEATHELELAWKLDPNDPTAWLYLSLLDRQLNRVNDAVRHLTRALELNDNRSVYRSRLLLDQDRAVATANQATAFRDAGMTDVSVQSAARALVSDYTSASAHQFLATATRYRSALIFDTKRPG